MSYALKCDNCFYPINHKEHYDKCLPIMMWGNHTQLVNDNFKQMMTFGLGGCTSIVMVFFDKNKNKPVKVFFGHHPSKDIIIKWYEKNYTTKFNIVVIIKASGEYTKSEEDEYDKLKVYDSKFWHQIIKSNCKLILEPYTEKQSNDNEFNSTLYIKKGYNFDINYELLYTNNYGKRIPLFF